MNVFYDKLENKTMDGSFDLTFFYWSSLAYYWMSIEYWSWGFIYGVGRTVECSKRVDDIIKTKSEWEKLGSGAATTLMALVPTFLAFGNL